jgi:hypothetical protein
MRRTQLYLDETLWTALHSSAAKRRTTISELVREAVRERYFGRQDEKRKAMQQFVGIRGERSSDGAAVDVVRSLRRSDRLRQLHAK